MKQRSTIKTNLFPADKRKVKIDQLGALEQMGGNLIRTIGQARANFAMVMMAACYNLKRLTYLKRARIEAF